MKDFYTKLEILVSTYNRKEEQFKVRSSQDDKEVSSILYDKKNH